MRFRAVATGATACALALGGCTPSDTANDPRQLPGITLSEFGGDARTDLSTMRGPLVVNLWASYCKPCREEMPILQEFHEAHGDEVAVVGIDYQDPQRENAQELVRETGVTYRLLADPLGDLNSADPFPNLMGLPFLALVDEDGDVVHMEYGEVDSLGKLEGLVSEHLDVDL